MPIVSADEPALVAGLRDREDQRREPARDEYGTGQVEAMTAASRLSLQEERHEHEGDEPDRDVDEEDPLPAECVGQDTAEKDARDGAEATDGAPDTQRDVALTAFGERRGSGSTARRA